VLWRVGHSGCCKHAKAAALMHAVHVACLALLMLPHSNTSLVPDHTALLAANLELHEFASTAVEQHGPPATYLYIHIYNM
jgi:hypothetical protein